MTHDLVVRGDDLDVAVNGGRIAEVGPGLGAGREEIDARGLLVLPGAIDAHVHLDDPGRADWEGFATGTRALAAGGVTCACDMPLNSLPPTLDAAAFDAKVAAARGRARVNFALWGGLVPGDLSRLDALAERGVVGLKAFMCPSGVDEFPAADPDTLGRGMERAAALGLPVAVHAEDPAIVGRLAEAARAAGRTSMADWAASRPPEAELEAIALALSLAEQAGCALHVVHVSTAEGVDLVAAARARGVDATCEACPHHLVLDGTTPSASARWPSARRRCDHPPRGGPSGSAWRPAPWTSWPPTTPRGRRRPRRGRTCSRRGAGSRARRRRWPCCSPRGRRSGVGPARAAGLMGAAPAARLGLAGKGALEPGADADLAIVRLGEPWTLQAADLEYRHRHSPFTGRRLTARVVRTILRGRTVWGEGADLRAPGEGRLVTPAAAVAR